jgi:predicted DNA-binding transcriptional regulator AlpA
MSTRLTESRFLTKKVVARRNGVHTGTIDRWVRQGQFPHPVKLSKKGGCRWPETVITSWEQAQMDQINQLTPTNSHWSKSP